MKKKIISNTRMFLIILLFVNLFGGIFGKSNILVGVTVLVSILVLKHQDLTKNLYSNLMKLTFYQFDFGGFFSYIKSSYLFRISAKFQYFIANWIFFNS